MGASAGTLNKKSTALEVVQHFNTNDSIRGKTVIVTGGNSGIGLETVKVFAYSGARVILASRTIENGNKAIEEEVKQLGHGGYKVEDTSNIVVKALDLTDLHSIKAFADDINTTESRIDLLVLNAGVMAIPNLTYTKFNFEMQIGTNHFGHFYLTQLLLPKIEKQDFPSRIVVLSSTAHNMGSINLKDLHYKNGRSYSAWGSYGQSKLSNILFAKELADRLKDTKATAVSLHPGVIATNLSRHMNLSPFIQGLFRALITDKTIPQGASTTLYACLAPELSNQENRGVYLDNCAIKLPNAEGRDTQGEKRKSLWLETEKQINEALATLSTASKL